MAAEDNGYELTKPQTGGGGGAEKTAATLPAKKAANPNKCTRCRTGSYQDKTSGFLCCAKTVRVCECEACGASAPKAS